MSFCAAPSAVLTPPDLSREPAKEEKTCPPLVKAPVPALDLAPVLISLKGCPGRTSTVIVSKGDSMFTNGRISELAEVSTAA